MQNKKGFAYYNTDTDRYQDIRIKRLKKVFGCCGVAIYDYLLCEIYRVKGCFIQWDESTAFDVAEYWGLKENVVNEVVGYCCNVGLFNKELRASENVLTSLSIQRRFTEMCHRAKRKDVEIPEYLTIPPEETRKTPEETPIPPEEFNRVEKSRVEKSKVVIPSSKVSKMDYEKLIETFGEKSQLEVWKCVREFIETYKPQFIEPYFDAWNLFAIKCNLIKEPQRITDKRRKKFDTRIREQDFDFIKILEKIKSSSFLKGNNNNGWKVSIEFILDSEENYTKILEGKYE